MNPKLMIRKTHRWLAIIIGIQLLFWTISGAYFSLVHIKTVRGEDRSQSRPSPALSADTALLSPAQIIAASDNPVHRLSLQNSSKGQPVYALYNTGMYGGKHPYARVDARSGEKLPFLDAKQAQEKALQDYTRPAQVQSVNWIKENPPSEYKGPLPVWRVMLDDARQTHLYISPVDGQVLARRNNWWRTFDFLWMLHILDFDQRENFNNTLLRVIAPAAVVVVLSGYLLWWVSRRRKKTARNV